MTKTPVLFAALLLTACGGPDHTTAYVCSCEQMEKVQAFVTANTAAANNHSDEEMEDVIHELWLTGVRTTCPQRTVEWDFHRGEPVHLDTCQTAIR